MARPSNDKLSQLETACGSLLYELQIIWDEVGESNDERDKVLLDIEQECLEVYRRKVDQANRCRAQLRQAIADYEAELASICSAMGEPPVHIRQSNKRVGSLREELKSITPQLEEMSRRKAERLNQFFEVIEQIKKISNEIMPDEYNPSKFIVDQSDLSTRKLEDLYRDLETLRTLKSNRLKQVMEHLYTLNALCSVLGFNFIESVREIHPSLNDAEGSKDLSNATIEKLATAIQSLREIKLERMKKLQDLASTMLELWSLMDTPIEEQQLFQNVTCNIAASEEEITEADTLSADSLNFVEKEVMRLEQLKVSKMKELVLKKKTELEELRRRTHLVAEAQSEADSLLCAIESGAIDASLILEQIEIQISEVKEEAFSRKDILEKVEKWLAACDEEAWLEEYNRDENRYNAGRGAHLMLKRAEKARAFVNKIPAIVETLATKITLWEKERDIEFTYDGVRLLLMLEEYTIVRQEKEQERKRQRDQKKLQDQLIAEQEALYGSKPSPSKPQSTKKLPRTSNVGGRRLSIGGSAIQTPKRTTKKMDEQGTLSPSARGLDIADLPVKKLSYTATITHREVDTPRKPFAPLLPVHNIPSTPSKPILSTSEGNGTQNTMPVPTPKIPTTVPVSADNIPSTPSKPTISTFEENKIQNAMPVPTPKIPTTVPIPANNIPSTPSKPSISAFEKENKISNAKTVLTPQTPKVVPEQMQVATTPAPTCLFNDTLIQVAPVETEYSFEERRLGLYLRR
ncbi:65-kDa microtubule-associated protein 3-like [Canna indica]|uniref:65-kDa microtubule-associated protein 3-like n=1 Tax=Canna indica TaxID=4628 RepID=A0AAQ3JZ41_9LILI|nr:65-kDa microtubule-associated protein 3-like [Canna indica]